MKNQIYLAIDYGSEGWRLEAVETAEEAFKKIKNGDTYGQKWKILKELSVTLMCDDNGEIK